MASARPHVVVRASAAAVSAAGAPALEGVSSAARERTPAALAPATAAKSAALPPITLRRPMASANAESLALLSWLMIGALFGFAIRLYRYTPVRVWPSVGRLSTHCSGQRRRRRSCRSRRNRTEVSTKDRHSQ